VEVVAQDLGVIEAEVFQGISDSAYQPASCASSAASSEPPRTLQT